VNKLLCGLRCNQALKKLSEGDKTSLTVLYDCMADQMYALAFSILKNPADAEDAMQETFLKVLQRIDTYRENGNARAWLLSVTRNASIDILRERKNTLSMDDPDIMEQPGEKTDMAQRVMIGDALMALTQTDRQIVVLKAVSGMNFAEISRIVDLPLTTVQKRYQRARKKLMSQLQR